MGNICYRMQVMIKNKNFLKQFYEFFSGAGKNASIVIMAAAAVTGMLELSNHQDTKITLLNKPVLAFAGNSTVSDNPLRREKESTETGTVQISYNTVQRTPARSIGIK